MEDFRGFQRGFFGNSLLNLCFRSEGTLSLTSGI